MTTTRTRRGRGTSTFRNLGTLTSTGQVPGHPTSHLQAPPSNFKLKAPSNLGQYSTAAAPAAESALRDRSATREARALCQGRASSG